MEKMSKVISNTSPIIALCIIDNLDLLWNIYDDVYIPRVVFDEITSGNPERIKGKKELKKAVDNGKIAIYDVQDKLFVQKMLGKLHKGEVETIVGARQLNTDFVVIDERAARIQAQNYFLTPIGTLGILRIAKKKGLVKEIKPFIETLLLSGFRLSKPLYERVLRKENEM